MTDDWTPKLNESVLILGSNLVGICTALSPFADGKYEILDEIYRSEYWPRGFIVAYEPSWWEWRRRNKLNRIRAFIADQKETK